MDKEGATSEDESKKGSRETEGWLGPHRGYTGTLCMGDGDP